MRVVAGKQQGKWYQSKQILWEAVVVCANNTKSVGKVSMWVIQCSDVESTLQQVSLPRQVVENLLSRTVEEDYQY